MAELVHELQSKAATAAEAEVTGIIESIDITPAISTAGLVLPSFNFFMSPSYFTHRLYIALVLYATNSCKKCVALLISSLYNGDMNDKRNTLVAWLRIGFGLLIVVAFVVQMGYTLGRGGNLTNFFSFFTIQSNLLTAAVLLISGVGLLLGARVSRQFAFIRGAVTLYMVVTGIVFALLLSGLEQRLQLTIPWVNMVFHQLMPVVMIVDWLLFPPKPAITFRRALLWLIFPVVYLIYTLVRGPLVNWYPYPFLDPPQVGWPYVIVTCVAIAIGAAGLAWLLALRTKRY